MKILMFIIALLVISGCGYSQLATSDIDKNDKKVLMMRGDIAATIKSVKARVFVSEIDTKSPDGYKNDDDCGKASCSGWGEWMLKVAKLDPRSWEAKGNAISPKFSELCGYIIKIENSNLVLDINEIKSDDKYCQALKESYPENERKKEFELF